jgi:hypothetical protein
MLNLAKYGFSAVGRAPQHEHWTLESALERAINEVFAGWPSKWEFNDLRNGGKSYGFGFSSEHVLDGLKMEISVNVTQIFVITAIDLEERGHGVEAQLHHSAVPHGIQEASTKSFVDHDVNAMIIKTLKSAVTSCRKSVQKCIDNGSNLDDVTSIVAKWKS